MFFVCVCLSPENRRGVIFVRYFWGPGRLLANVIVGTFREIKGVIFVGRVKIVKVTVNLIYSPGDT